MKKYIVEFGCFKDEIPLEILETLCDETDEKTTDEIKVLSEKKLDKYYKQKKEDMLAVLKKEPSINEISPLDNDIETKGLFMHSHFGEPIRFKIKLPIKNQEISQRFYYGLTGYENLEEFNIIFNGNIFAIYQEVNPTKKGFLGGPELRDKIYEIFKAILPNLKIVPPTPFRQDFVYLVSYPDIKIADEKEKNSRNFVFDLDKVDFDKEIYRIFNSMEFYLTHIYETFDLYHEIDDIAQNIIITQRKLNPVYKNFIDSNFLDNFNYNKKKSIKKLTHELSEEIFDYVSAVNMFERSLSKTIFRLNDSPLNNYIKDLKNETNEYTKIDIDVLYKYIQSITNDINTRSVNFSTITAGIIGGVIGAVGTIIVTIINKP